jgi:hypothetical protein
MYDVIFANARSRKRMKTDQNPAFVAENIDLKEIVIFSSSSVRGPQDVAGCEASVATETHQRVTLHASVDLLTCPFSRAHVLGGMTRRYGEHSDHGDGHEDFCQPHGYLTNSCP